MKSKTPLRLTLSGLVLLFLTACAAPSPPQVLYLKTYPPAQLLLACPKPIVDVRTNEDLVTLSVELGRALDACDDDKTSLREWASEDPPK